MQKPTLNSAPLVPKAELDKQKQLAMTQAGHIRRLYRRIRHQALALWFYRAVVLALIVLLIAGRQCGADQPLSACETNPTGRETPAREGTSIFPPSIQAFATHVVATEGQPDVAREIADAVSDVGLPALPLPPEDAVCLLLAVMRYESSFQPGVTGRASEVGLMQWTPCFFASYTSTDDYYDIRVNIAVGAKVLGEKIECADGDVWLGVQRYNSPRARKPGRYASRVRYYYTIYRLMLTDFEPPMEVL